MKKLYFLNEEEKERILNMHRNASQKHYLRENKSKIFALHIEIDYDKLMSLSRKEPKRIARGYRNINNFIDMLYLIAANLKFDFPHKFI